MTCVLRAVRVFTQMLANPHSASILKITHDCMTHLQTTSPPYTYDVNIETHHPGKLQQ